MLKLVKPPLLISMTAMMEFSVLEELLTQLIVSMFVQKAIIVMAGLQFHALREPSDQIQDKMKLATALHVLKESIVLRLLWKLLKETAMKVSTAQLVPQLTDHQPSVMLENTAQQDHIKQQIVLEVLIKTKPTQLNAKLAHKVSIVQPELRPTPSAQLVTTVLKALTLKNLAQLVPILP